MKRGIRYGLSGVAGLALAAYLGAVGFLMAREDTMVFSGAGRTGARGAVPAAGTGLTWDSVRVRADDGVPVFLLESRLGDPAADPWVIFFHGNGALVGDRGCVERYRLLREAGFDVLAVEFRGYGESAPAGPPSEEGVFADARAAWTYLTSSLGVDGGRIVVYGWSLGSGPATYLAVEKHPAGLITEGAFTSLPDIGADRYPWMPVRAVMHTRFDNLRRAPDVSVPWLIFHGRSDEIVPFSHGEALEEAAPDARLIPLGAGHDDGVTGDRDIALATLRKLSAEIMEETVPRSNREDP